MAYRYFSNTSHMCFRTYLKKRWKTRAKAALFWSPCLISRRHGFVCHALREYLRNYLSACSSSIHLHTLLLPSLYTYFGGEKPLDIEQPLINQDARMKPLLAYMWMLSKTSCWLKLEEPPYVTIMVGRDPEFEAVIDTGASTGADNNVHGLRSLRRQPPPRTANLEAIQSIGYQVRLSSTLPRLKFILVQAFASMRIALGGGSSGDLDVWEISSLKLTKKTQSSI